MSIEFLLGLISTGVVLVIVSLVFFAMWCIIDDAFGDLRRRKDG